MRLCWPAASPRAAGIAGEAGPQVLGYRDVLRGAPVGLRVAVIGAGGIGFDVAEFLVHQGQSPALDAGLWRREWGVGDPALVPGGWQPVARSRNRLPAKSGCCSASRKSPGASWARPPAGFTAPRCR